MKVIIVRDDRTQSYTYSGSWDRLFFFCGAMLSLCFCLGIGSAYLWSPTKSPATQAPELMNDWQAQIDEQQNSIDVARQQVQGQLDAFVLRLSELQARITRIDALGDRLTAKVDLGDGEFNFSSPPAIGGPQQEVAHSEAPRSSDLMAYLDELTLRIGHREQQLDILDNILSDRELDNETFLAGLPIKNGWLSSRYGRRTDPFSGKIAWHNGVDFAGKHGSDIIAVAAGVVVWSGKRYGYGLTVEINHGNGFVTRYAHNENNLVVVGDIVTRGQTIAKMGSSGRSTGPHVHLEILKDDQSQDPTKYIYRAGTSIKVLP